MLHYDTFKCVALSARIPGSAVPAVPTLSWANCPVGTINKQPFPGNAPTLGIGASSAFKGQVWGKGGGRIQDRSTKARPTSGQSPAAVRQSPYCRVAGLHNMTLRQQVCKDAELPSTFAAPSRRRPFQQSTAEPYKHQGTHPVTCDHHLSCAQPLDQTGRAAALSSRQYAAVRPCMCPQ
jgi:hypothetical protein